MGAGDFDFWLGRWEVRWDGDARGTNEIAKILGGRVIEERFDGRPGIDFQGMSVSVYDEQAGLWCQTWVDSEGAYLEFEGLFGDGVMELRGEQRSEPRRMQWLDIAPDSLTWLWQRPATGGSGWETLWRLDYSRLA